MLVIDIDDHSIATNSSSGVFQCTIGTPTDSEARVCAAMTHAPGTARAMMQTTTPPAVASTMWSTKLCSPNNHLLVLASAGEAFNHKQTEPSRKNISQLEVQTALHRIEYKN